MQYHQLVTVLILILELIAQWVCYNYFVVLFYLGRCQDSCGGIERGICDYSTGLCSCYPDFFGETCELTQCPSKCGDFGGTCDYSTGRCLCNAVEKLDGGGDCVLGILNH